MQQILKLGAEINPVGLHIPVEDDFARACEGQRLALGIRHQALCNGSAGKSVLHHCKADQHDDQHHAAQQGRPGDFIGQSAIDGNGRRPYPGHQQGPGRHQHDGAVIAKGGEIGDQHQADGSGHADGDTGHASRHRGIEQRHAHQRRNEQQPQGDEMHIAHMPAVKIEIGEQEDHESCGKHSFGCSPPDTLGLCRNLEQFGEKAEIDCQIGQDSPGQGRSGRKDHGALHHEDDGQKERQQGRNAQHNATIQRQAVDPLGIGIRLPKRELRQAVGGQFRHESDRCARIKRDQESVVAGVLLAFRSQALARRDGADAGAAQIRPDHAGADKSVMRCHQQAVDLLIRVIGQREGDPIRPGAHIKGAHLDAPHDAIRSRCRGDGDPVALRLIALNR